MNSNKFYISAIIIGIIFMGATNLLASKVKNRLIKYIPAGIAAVAAFVLYLKAFHFSEGFEGIPYFVLMIIMASVFAAALVTAVVTGIIKNKNRG